MQVMGQTDSIHIKVRYLSNGMWRHDNAGVFRYSPLQFKQVAGTNNVIHTNGEMKDQRFCISVSSDIIPGVYRIVPGENNIIINKKEKEIAYTINTTNKDSVSVDFNVSDENRLYQNYLRQSIAQIKRIEELERKYNATGNENLQTKIENERKQYQNSLNDFCLLNDGTWAALLVKNSSHHFAPLGLDSIQAKQYLHQSSYWTGIDTNNPKLINSPLYYDVIEKYIFYYFDKDLKIAPDALGDSLIHAADTILTHFGANEDTKSFAVKHLEALFMTMGQEKPLYFVDTFYASYLDNCGQCNDDDDKKLTEQFHKRLERDRVISEGLPAPEIDIVDNQGKHKRLKDIPGSRLLLMFWQDGCSHCEEQMPQIEEYLRKYPNSVTVLAICITPNNKSYHDKATAFPHLLFTCDNKTGKNKYDGAAAKAYFINGTPSYFLLDKDRKFIGAYYAWDKVRTKLQCKN
jgi:thiol-disulfide isomerase/thioredoxin